ncbi:MAG: hypothetical protein D6807_08605 [Alphaproteobacteria bacterium]|nr:MAG: hypothetical protein D6807_08605 [Alphaproteobacteria bacterium]
MDKKHVAILLGVSAIMAVVVYFAATAVTIDIADREDGLSVTTERNYWTGRPLRRKLSKMREHWSFSGPLDKWGKPHGVWEGSQFHTDPPPHMDVWTVYYWHGKEVSASEYAARKEAER